VNTWTAAILAAVIMLLVSVLALRFGVYLGEAVGGAYG
jgi:hypothetical protein